MGNHVINKIQNISKRKPKGEGNANPAYLSLVEAIKKGDFLLVKSMVFLKRVSARMYDENGNTVLHIAVYYNQIDLLKFLIDISKPINLEDKNFDGDTPLMIACMKGHIEIVHFLIKEEGCDPNSRENTGTTPFIAACANGHEEVAKYLLEYSKANYRILNKLKQSAIHKAAYFGENKILKFLSKYTSLNFNSKDKFGNSPIHMSAKRINLKSIRTILQIRLKNNGVLDEINKFGQTPLMILKDQINKITLESTQEIECYEIKRYLIDKSFKINVQLPYFEEKGNYSRKKSSFPPVGTPQSKGKFKLQDTFGNTIRETLNTHKNSRANSNVVSLKSFKYDHQSKEDIKFGEESQNVLFIDKSEY